jgi:hypothetical protein
VKILPQLSFCPPQIPHGLLWDLTRAWAVRNSKLPEIYQDLNHIGQGKREGTPAPKLHTSVYMFCGIEYGRSGCNFVL